MTEHVETLPRLRWDEPRKAYDVVIVGGGGHGLATAYYLATRHGITNVAVVEADYIVSGNTGRNTTIIRANYGIPEAVRFYQHSLAMYESLEDETGARILHQTKGLVWLAHTETALRSERARCLMNTACGAETVMITPAEIKEIVPQIDLTGGGRYPVLVQVNVDLDATKAGFAPDAIPTAMGELLALPHLAVRGLMTVGRLTDDTTVARRTFSALRQLSERTRSRWPELGPELSMGMSDDFEIAVEEGATIVRVGRALFGEREAGQVDAREGR